MASDCLFVGAMSPGAAPPLRNRPATTLSVTAAAPPPPSSTVRPPGAAPVPHVNLTAAGPSSFGRTFAYGYDLATSISGLLIAPTVQGALHVTQSIPGSFIDEPIMVAMFFRGPGPHPPHSPATRDLARIGGGRLPGSQPTRPMLPGLHGQMNSVLLPWRQWVVYTGGWFRGEGLS